VKFVFFWFQATEKMDSMVKGLMGAIPPPGIFGLQPPRLLIALPFSLSIKCFTVLLTAGIIIRTLVVTIEDLILRGSFHK